MKHTLAEILAPLMLLAKAMVPGALGAAVAVAVQSGLTWTQRFLQLAVGIIVSYYAGEASTALFDVEDVVRNAIGFTAGIAAFETVKSLRVSIAEVAKTAPKQAWDWWLSQWDRFLGPKK